LDQQKAFYGEDWIFSQMQTKPDYLKRSYDAPRTMYNFGDEDNQFEMMSQASYQN
jgi:hypothetical protein